MKNRIAVALALIVMFCAFSYDDKTKSADFMAQQVVNSLQQSSTKAFVELLPTLEDFHQIMEANASIYGSSLKEAKEEFTSAYILTILPEAKESFEAILRDGKEQGIDWKDVSFVRIESTIETTKQSASTFDIIVAFNNKEFTIRLKNALQINGQWKVSQFVKLI